MNQPPSPFDPHGGGPSPFGGPQHSPFAQQSPFAGPPAAGPFGAPGQAPPGAYPSQMGSGHGAAPASGGNKGALIALLIILGVSAVGAALYFSGVFHALIDKEIRSAGSNLSAPVGPSGRQVPVPSPAVSPPVATVPRSSSGAGVILTDPERVSGSITDADYPAAAIREEAEGTTRITLIVDADGRVSECTVIDSSGSGVLDQAACTLAQRRFRYRPATHGGTPTDGMITEDVEWRLPPL